MNSAIKKTAWMLGMLAVASTAFAEPPPTNVVVNKVQGIDKTTGAFILEWSPAIDAKTGSPYPKYLLSAGCKYEGMDDGTSAGPTGVSGLWQVTVTKNAFRVKVTCSCAVSPTRVNSIRTAPSNPYAPGSGWVNTQKFTVPCGKPS